MDDYDKIYNINDFILQEIIEICAKSSLEMLNKTDFKSAIWDIYISGLSYGIWMSICDLESINLSDISDSINDYVRSFLN